ncbi:MAG: hypothetical protein Q8O67_19945 [Deltaproteobacteria bacterium]|nr:hypothetical protein [Deltaproteobacteria bacterium]
MSKLLFIAPVFIAAVAGCVDRDNDGVSDRVEKARAAEVVETHDRTVANDLDARIAQAEARLARANAAMRDAEIDARYDAWTAAAQRDLAEARAERDRLAVSAEVDYELNRRRAVASLERLERSTTDLEANLRKLGRELKTGAKEMKQDAADLKNSIAEDKDGVPLNGR